MNTTKILLFAVSLFLGNLVYGQLENIPLITVVGEGMVQVEPDHVLIELRFEKSVSANDYNSMLDIFKSNELNVNIFGLSQNSQEESLIQLNNGSGNTYSKSISLELNDVKKLESVLIDLRKGGFNIGNIEYRVKDKGQNLAQASSLALKDAKNEARNISRNYFQDIGEAHTIKLLNRETLSWYKQSDRQKLELLNKESKYQIEPFKMVFLVKVEVSFDLYKE